MFRRRVFYIPGYDPFPPRRYRELFRRESAAQAEISGYRLEMTERTDRTGFGWAARTEGGVGEFEVLVWSDIVRGSMGRSVAATYGQLVRTVWAYVASGALIRLMRLRRGPVIAALYPVAVLIIQALAAFGVAMLTGWIASRWIGPWGGVAVGAVAGWAMLDICRRLDRHVYAYYLMHDYAFTAQHGGACPTALDARIDQFARRIADAAPLWDEVLVVGHSSGAHIAVSALARLARGSGVPPSVALLTLGHVVPMASFLPRAGWLSRDLHDLAAARPGWVDVTAPSDACCFALCDPVAVSGATPAGGGGPLILSAAFSQTLSPDRRAALRGKWFRLHFQYLCAFDRPGDYDYFRITTGALPLARRFAGRGHSPGRIAGPPPKAAP